MVRHSAATMSLLCGILLSAGAPVLADEPTRVIKVDHGVADYFVGFSQFDCKKVNKFVNDWEKQGCLDGSGRPYACEPMRTAVNTLNWGKADPANDGIDSLKGGIVLLGSVTELAGVSLEEVGPLQVTSLSDDSDSAKIMRMTPVRGVPSLESIFVQGERNFAIRSNAHYCDWLAGKIRLSFVADVKVPPVPLSGHERQEFWRAYEAARSAGNDLKGEGKALLQGYLFLSSLPEPLIEPAGGVAALMASIFFLMDVPLLQEFQNSDELLGFITFQRPATYEKTTFVLEGQQ